MVSRELYTFFTAENLERLKDCNDSIIIDYNGDESAAKAIIASSLDKNVIITFNKRPESLEALFEIITYYYYAPLPHGNIAPFSEIHENLNDKFTVENRKCKDCTYNNLCGIVFCKNKPLPGKKCLELMGEIQDAESLFSSRATINEKYYKP